MDAATMVERLRDIPVNSTLFVSYLAGRKASPQAVREAARSRSEGIAPRHFTGRFVSLTFTQKWKEPVLTVWVEERDSAGAPNGRGAYRAFNPCLGRLVHLEVLERATQQAQ
jgi:hypothetical protein